MRCANERHSPVDSRRSPPPALTVARARGSLGPLSAQLLRLWQRRNQRGRFSSPRCILSGGVALQRSAQAVGLLGPLSSVPRWVTWRPAPKRAGQDKAPQARSYTPESNSPSIHGDSSRARSPVTLFSPRFSRQASIPASLQRQKWRAAALAPARRSFSASC